jgi:hypothetical protein
MEVAEKLAGTWQQWKKVIPELEVTKKQNPKANQ